MQNAISTALTAAHHAPHFARALAEYALQLTLPGAFAKYGRRLPPELLAGLQHHGKLFIHIPKAGGTSVSTALYGSSFGHHSWRDFRRTLPQSQYQATLRFAVVRDPVARFESAYYSLVAGAHLQPVLLRFAKRYIFPYRGINEFALALSRDQFLRGAVMYLAFFRHQGEFVATRGRRLTVHRLVPMERLVEDVADITGVDRAAIPHLRRGDRSQREALSSDVVGYLRQLYRPDFELHRLALLANGTETLNLKYTDPATFRLLRR